MSLAQLMTVLFQRTVQQQSNGLPNEAYFARSTQEVLPHLIAPPLPTDRSNKPLYPTGHPAPSPEPIQTSPSKTRAGRGLAFNRKDVPYSLSAPNPNRLSCDNPIPA